VESYGNDRNNFCVKAENAEIRQKTVLKTAKTAKILFCRQKFSNFSMKFFSPFGLNFFFLFLKKSSNGFLNQHIRRKKEEEKIRDVKFVPLCGAC
jgi:hypothetical protein